MDTAAVFRHPHVAFLALIAAILAQAGAPSAGDEPSPNSRGVVRIVFAGDVMLDGGPGHFAAHGGDPFAHLASVLRDADLTVANLECALATRGQSVHKDFTFLAKPNCLPILKRYFSAVSLANNHSGDWGKEGFASELELLESVRLPYFGGGRNAEAARRPLVLTAGGRRVALLGYNDFPPRSFAAGPDTPGIAWAVEANMIADVKAARAAHRGDLVIPFLHWGVEEQPRPTESQQVLARKLIDAGADAIVGAHPHVTQTIEWYRGRPIIYSLGNCVFDYFPKDPPVWIGWVAQLTFGKPTGTELSYHAIQLDPAGIPHLVSKAAARNVGGSTDVRAN